MDDEIASDFTRIFYRKRSAQQDNTMAESSGAAASTQAPQAMQVPVTPAPAQPPVPVAPAASLQPMALSPDNLSALAGQAPNGNAMPSQDADSTISGATSFMRVGEDHYEKSMGTASSALDEM